MEFKPTKTKLIISDDELYILEQTLDIFTRLTEDMEDKEFSTIISNNLVIDFDSLEDIVNCLDALTNDDKIEVE